MGFRLGVLLIGRISGRCSHIQNVAAFATNDSSAGLGASVIISWSFSRSCISDNWQCMRAVTAVCSVVWSLSCSRVRDMQYVRGRAVGRASADAMNISIIVCAFDIANIGLIRGRQDSGVTFVVTLLRLMLLIFRSFQSILAVNSIPHNIVVSCNRALRNCDFVILVTVMSAPVRSHPANLSGPP